MNTALKLAKAISSLKTKPMSISGITAHRFINKVGATGGMETRYQRQNNREDGRNFRDDFETSVRPKSRDRGSTLRLVRVQNTTSRPAHLQEKPPRRGGRGGLAGVVSIDGIPDDGVEVCVVLTGGTAQIGLELLGPEGRIGEAERDIIFAGRLAPLAPPGTDLNTTGINPVVGLGVAVLGGIEQDIDGSFERQGLELALKTRPFAWLCVRLQA
jgi:hypothetical protein